MIKALLKGDITQKEVLEYYNTTVSYIPLPDNVNGFIWSYLDVNNIFINKSLSYYKRKKTLLHELAHIELNQLNQIDKDLFAFKIDKYEDEADKYLKKLEV